MKIIPFVSGYRADEWRLLRGRLTFTGAEGFGQFNGASSGVITIATVTGQVELISTPRVYCSEALAGATATIDFGYTATPTNYISAKTATQIALDDWIGGDSGDSAGAEYYGANGHFHALADNLELDVDTANITDGQLDFFIWWRPLSSNGNLVLGANLVAI